MKVCVKKNCFLLLLVFLATGCSNKNVDFVLPFKGEKENVTCNNIKINSNNEKIEEIFKKYFNKIIFVKNNKVCNLFVDNKLNLKTNFYYKKFKLIYRNDPCNYFVKECINKNNLLLCSKPIKNKKLYFQIIKKSKFKNNKYYLYNNKLYVIYSFCKPKTFSLLCQKTNVEIDNKFLLNNKIKKSYFTEFNIEPCKSYSSEIPIHMLEELKQKIKKTNKIIEKEIYKEYDKEINNFIDLYFPNYKNTNLELNDFSISDIEDKKIKQIFKNILENKYSIEDYNYINSYLSGNLSKSYTLKYYKVKFIKHIMFLKLGLINKKNIKTIKKELNKDIIKLEKIKTLETTNMKEIEKLKNYYLILEKILNNVFVRN